MQAAGGPAAVAAAAGGVAAPAVAPGVAAGAALAAPSGMGLGVQLGWPAEQAALPPQLPAEDCGVAAAALPSVLPPVQLLLLQSMAGVGVAAGAAVLEERPAAKAWLLQKAGRAGAEWTAGAAAGREAAAAAAAAGKPAMEVVLQAPAGRGHLRAAAAAGQRAQRRLLSAVEAAEVWHCHPGFAMVPAPRLYCPQLVVAARAEREKQSRLPAAEGLALARLLLAAAAPAASAPLPAGREGAGAHRSVGCSPCTRLPKR